MKNATEHLTSCFYLGKYDEVVRLLGQAMGDPTDPDFFAKSELQVGALVFTGLLSEAEALFNLACQHSPSPSFKCSCQFFLGVGATRKSDYGKAKNLFAQNLAAIARDRLKTKFSPRARFFAMQGVSFFNFYRGRYKNSSKFAERAYIAAIESKFTYGQVLALDSLGNSLCFMGQIRRGLHELERAFELASSLENGGLADAIKISILTHRSGHGINPAKAVQNLKKAIDALNPSNTFSKVELYLELIRQHLLRGQTSEAQHLINDASSLVYRHQNQRQMARFNLRYAHLLLIRGEPTAGLALANAVRANLNPSIDVTLFAQMQGLIAKITDTLKLNQSPNKGPAQSYLDHRIRLRLQKSNNQQFKVGEDPLGDLLDEVAAKGFTVYEKILQSGYLGLLPGALGLPAGAEGVLLGPSRGQLIVLSKGDVRFVDKGITTTQAKLLEALHSSEFASKERLVETVWGHRYNPLMHDNLLYSTLARLRQALGPFANWIEWSASGYRLNRAIIRWSPRSTKLWASATEPKPSATQPPAPDLNLRQVRLLQNLKDSEAINVRAYAKKYKICTMTAFRDLAHLQKTGYLVRVGKGRATYYVAPF